jgi:hypothetical protein
MSTKHTRRRAKPKPIKSSEEIFQALVAQRNLTSPFDLALATQITNSLVAGDLAEAVRALQHLPAPVRFEAGSQTLGAADARARILQLIMNAKAADAIEEAAAEQEEAEAENSALQAAEARIQQLEDEVLHLRGVKPRMLPPPSAKPLKATKSESAKAAPIDAYAAECARIEKLRKEFAPNEAPWTPAKPGEAPKARPGWLTRIQADLANANGAANAAREMTRPSYWGAPEPSIRNAYAAAPYGEDYAPFSGNAFRREW